MLLNVHDEFDSSVLKSKLQRVDKDVRGILECFDGSTTPFSLRVPIRSSSGTGPNWWEASK
jgi:DNA polymerase I-like protein with 3'-5' exonuclease and polymerase domains